jgi:hypothetical protein
MKKEQRRNQYEMRKLLALNQRQKLVISFFFQSFYVPQNTFF